jgi:predicted nucleotide-binding protein (sugar kinase/HSP70/actin superfamily)
MAAVSKHYGDVNMWIEKIIDSCNSNKQLPTIRRLIQQFDKMLKDNNTLDFYFKLDIIRGLETKLENKTYYLIDENACKRRL